jgi:uncharacterized protein (TIGR00369 family)
MNRLLNSFENGRKNFVREAYDRLSRVPGGKRLFDRLVGFAAPYTGTIGARVSEVRRGYARVTLTERRAVQNPFRSIHAIALANLAELCGNLAMAYSMPDDARFIVGGMSIDYAKKARGTITAECECTIPSTNERREYEVPVVMRDREGDIVATATLRTIIGPKRTAGVRSDT